MLWMLFQLGSETFHFQLYEHANYIGAMKLIDSHFDTFASNFTIPIFDRFGKDDYSNRVRTLIALKLRAISCTVALPIDIISCILRILLLINIGRNEMDTSDTIEFIFKNIIMIYSAIVACYEYNKILGIVIIKADDASNNLFNCCNCSKCKEILQIGFSKMISGFIYLLPIIFSTSFWIVIGLQVAYLVYLYNVYFLFLLFIPAIGYIAFHALAYGIEQLNHPRGASIIGWFFFLAINFVFWPLLYYRASNLSASGDNTIWNQTNLLLVLRGTIIYVWTFGLATAEFGSNYTYDHETFILCCHSCELEYRNIKTGVNVNQSKGYEIDSDGNIVMDIPPSSILFENCIVSELVMDVLSGVSFFSACFEYQEKGELNSDASKATIAFALIEFCLALCHSLKQMFIRYSSNSSDDASKQLKFLAAFRLLRILLEIATLIFRCVGYFTFNIAALTSLFVAKSVVNVLHSLATFWRVFNDAGRYVRQREYLVLGSKDEIERVHNRRIRP